MKIAQQSTQSRREQLSLFENQQVLDTSNLQIIKQSKCKKLMDMLHKNSRYIVVAAITLLLLYYLFYVSYQFDEGLKCPYKNELQCLLNFYQKKRDEEVGYWLLLIGINSIIFTIFIDSLVFGRTLRILPFLGILQFYWLFLRGQFIMSATNMGGLFKIIHLVFALLAAILYGSFFLLRYIWKKSNKKILLAVIICLSLIAFFLAQNSCYFWKFGINGQILEQQNLCKVKKPDCKFLYFYLWDFSIFLREKSTQQQIDAYFPHPQNGSIIGFASSNTFEQKEIISQELQNSMFKHATRYKTLNQALTLQKHQVILDNQKQKYYIKVLRNESLAYQRKLLYEKAMNSTSPPLAKNVLFIFFDSISRAQAHLKLSKTLQWFKKSSKYESYLDSKEQKISESSKEAYQFYRYNSIGYQTNENCLAMYYGLPYAYKRDMPQQQYMEKFESLRFSIRNQNRHPEEIEFFGKDYQDSGYITSSVGTYCSISNSDLYQSHLKSYKPPKFDHQTHSFACDPNFQDPTNKNSGLMGPYSFSKHTLYGKKMSEYAFQYVFSFFDAYKDSPKIQVVNMIEGHDMIGGGSTKHADEPIREFFDEFEQRGYAKDTVIVFASDHGQHIARIFKEYLVEHYHGLLLVYLPKNINQKYRDTIRKNQQNLVTPWNIYYTLKHLAKGEESQQLNMSLLSNLSFQRTCQEAKIPITPPEICGCV